MFIYKLCKATFLYDRIDKSIYYIMEGAIIIKSFFKIPLIILGVISALILFILGFAGNYFYNLALNPDASKSLVFGEPSEEDSSHPDSDQVSQEQTSGATTKESQLWFHENSNFEDVYLTSSDNLKLHSYKITNPTPSHTWVISVHGYMSQGNVLSNPAKHFYDMGYNVLLPDLRGHGLSEGDYIGMGWDDRNDVIGWIDYILEQDPTAQIVLHGISMGAATVMSVSGEALPSNVKAVIEDCGYTSVWDQFASQLKGLFNLPEFPFMHAASLVTKIRAGYWLSEASPIAQVAKSKTPTLFIHGDQDNFVPYSMHQELYDASSAEKEILTIEGAGHAMAATHNADLYWSTISTFLGKYLD